MPPNVTAAAIIVCAGRGTRLTGQDKPLVRVRGIPLFAHAALAFQQVSTIKQIVLVLRKEHIRRAQTFFKKQRLCVPIAFVAGGKERKDSVREGLAAVDRRLTHVLIHDGARPFVSEALIKRIIRALKTSPAVVCGVKLRDTVKSVTKSIVTRTVERATLFSIQTPQGFKKKLLEEAFEKQGRKNWTDDAQLIEALGKKVRVVEGEATNIKITYLQDLVLADSIAGGSYRGGFGFDIHRFSKRKRPLILAGVRIPGGPGLEAVSDGDLVLHAASDAICGAAGLGDIGDHFPPSSPKSKGIDSQDIARFVITKLKGRYTLVNMDVTIVTDKPRLALHKPAMTKSLKKIFAVREVNVKIKSKEDLSILGGKESMACLVTVLGQKVC